MVSRLQKISESARDYTYLILTSQTSTRGQIVGYEARNLDAQRVFLNTFENIVKSKGRYSRRHTKVSKDFAIR